MTINNNLDMDDPIVELYFSSDVEADGGIPGPYSMSSFGMVAFATRTKSGVYTLLDLDADENCFYAELKPISDNFIPEAMAVSGLDREWLKIHGEEPAIAMKNANTFVGNVAERFGENVRPVFVAYPLGYDWMFIYWYLINFTGTSAFGHSSALDIKTMFATKARKAIRGIGKRSIPRSLMSKRKHTHNALDDAREQGDLCYNIFVWKP